MRTIADLSASTAASEEKVLVVVVNDPEELDRARHQNWYRIPVARAPRQVAAEYLAFYLTGAFSHEERWSVRWVAPALSYRVVRRVDLIPEEPDHPRALDLYYRVGLGPLETLDRPVVSHSLRRITFIPTTLSRLREASEINDLWLKGRAQERLWRTMKQAGIVAERQYPLREDDPDDVADFAVFCRQGKIAVMIASPDPDTSTVREYRASEYLLVAHDWTPLNVTARQLAAEYTELVHHLLCLIRTLGGTAD